jgi:putative DNA primase/helicase
MTAYSYTTLIDPSQGANGYTEATAINNNGQVTGFYFMRQDFFEYIPQFKLLLNGNHMPKLRTVNKAITRRFNRVPFSGRVPHGRGPSRTIRRDHGASVACR